MSREIVEVYADWQPIEAPLLIGLLAHSDSSRGGVFSLAICILRLEISFSAKAMKRLSWLGY